MHLRHTQPTVGGHLRTPTGIEQASLPDGQRSRCMSRVNYSSSAGVELRTLRRDAGESRTDEMVVLIDGADHFATLGCSRRNTRFRSCRLHLVRRARHLTALAFGDHEIGPSREAELLVHPDEVRLDGSA